MKKLNLILWILVIASVSHAQVNYTVSKLSATYTPIAVGTSPTLTAVTGYNNFDEGFANGIPIGFTFDFNGVSYSSFNINSNGFISLGTGFTTGGGYWNNSLNSGPHLYNSSTGYTAVAANRPLIAPLWDDLDLQTTSNIKYELTGTAPSRVLTIEWANAKWDYNAATAAISFQLKLYETTNIIDFVYSPLASTVSTSSGGASIGLRGVGTTALPPMLVVIDTATSINFTRVLEYFNTNKPSSGTTFRFSPTPITTDIAVTTVYSYGQAPTNHDAQVTSALISNLGSTIATNIPVTLTISGANSFTNTQTIPSLATGDTELVSFTAFLPSSSGLETVTISVAQTGDQDTTNNSISLPQEALADFISYQHFPSNSTFSSSIGTTNNGQFAVKVKNTGVKFVQSISFTSVLTPAPVAVLVYEDNGVGGAPGTTPVYTSATFTPSSSGFTSILLPSTVQVTGDFYIAVRQKSATNMNVLCEWELPYNRRKTFYLGSATGPWVDLSSVSGGNFRLAFSAQYGTNPLPINLVSFSGKKINKKNHLEWETENESNNKGFELERSQDAVLFNSIAFVPAKNQDIAFIGTNKYNYLDEQPLDGTNYYRLKQIDLNGQTTYSNVIAINESVSSMISIKSITPNPATDYIMVELSHHVKNATIHITDIMGKTLSRHSANNLSKIKIDLNSLSSGIYFVKLVTENELYSTRFVKN